MRHLDELVGQRTVIAQVLERQQLSRKECIVVAGSGGCGVSWTLGQIGIEWERRGGIALKASGAAITPPRPMFPWLTMASPARSTLARREVLKQSAAQASKAIPVVGEAASYLVNEVLNYRRKELARQTQVLGEREQDLLFVIENATQGKRLLLLIDQISDWDEESWSLLELIVSPVLHDFYVSLKDVLIVIGTSEDFLPRCRILVEKLPSHECHLEHLQREQLPAALETFGFSTMDDQEMGLLYEATGGRLDLLHDFGFLCRDFGAIGINTENALYGRMIERRLRALKGNILALEELLTVASFLGNAFSPDEAGCLTGYAPDEFQEVLRLAEEEQLLGITGGHVSFPSEAMQQYFRSSRLNDPGKYHRKFAECLRRLRPGDYATRCHHLLLAGDTNNALVCHCLASLDARRRRRIPPASNQLCGISGWEEFASYLEAMRAAYAAHDRDAVEEGLSILESIEAILPDALIAERDFLAAQIRLKSHHVSSFEGAVTILQRWLILQEREPEIWSRIAQVLIVALTETNRYEEASQLEETLTKYYGVRRTLDPWALYGLNCLRRRSECLHHLVPARNRLQSALAYFGPITMGSLPRHPLEYYYTLTNLISNLIASGAFAEAAVRSGELKALVESHPSFYWPSLEIVANNSVLAGYLAGVLSLPAATKLMREIDERRDGIGDRLLIQNNFAVLLIHGGELTQAKQILTAGLDQLDETADAYHRYFVSNNLAGLLALAGDLDRAFKMLAEVGPDLDRIPLGIRETLIKRHAMMSELIAAAPKLGPAKFDSFLKDHYGLQVGPQWAFYGRGFLMSDIQFWATE